MKRIALTLGLLFALWAVPAIASDVSLKAATYGGATPYHYLSAASNNSTNVKGTQGTVSEIVALNTTTTVYYLKLYDKATAPTCGTDTPVWTVPIPFGASNAGAGFVIPVPVGLAFANGIGFCITAAQADNDNTSAATGITINLAYK